MFLRHDFNPGELAVVVATAPANPGGVERLRRRTIELAGASLPIGIVLALVTRIRVDATGVAPVAALLSAALFASTLCSRSAARTRVSDCVGTLGLVWLSGITCGLISLIALRFHQPLIDAQLLGFDKAVGVADVRLVEWLAALPPTVMAAMKAAYTLTIPVMFVSIGLLAMIDERVEAWRAAFCFVGSLLTVCLVSIVTPAKGLGLWVSQATLAHLPQGALRYFWDNFDLFYAGRDPVLRLTSIDGVVSFPSFHTAMGLIAIAMWRKRPIALALVMVWALPMFAATLPLGGHYVADLLGGAGIWAAWFALSLRLQRTPER